MEKKLEALRHGLDIIFEPGSKGIVGAVVSVAYDDGTYEERSLLTDYNTNLKANLMGNLLTHCLHALLCCYLDLSGDVVKLSSAIKE